MFIKNIYCKKYNLQLIITCYTEIPISYSVKSSWFYIFIVCAISDNVFKIEMENRNTYKKERQILGITSTKGKTNTWLGLQF